MTAQTPTPWWAAADHPENACAHVRAKGADGYDTEIATLYGCADPDDKDENGRYPSQPIRDADAAFIVRAVNAHDDLVRELTQARHYVSAIAAKTTEQRVHDDLKAIDAALKQAEGGQ